MYYNNYSVYFVVIVRITLNYCIAKAQQGCQAKLFRPIINYIIRPIINYVIRPIINYIIMPIILLVSELLLLWKKGYVFLAALTRDD